MFTGPARVESETGRKKVGPQLGASSYWPPAHFPSVESYTSKEFKIGGLGSQWAVLILNSP